MGSPQTSTRKDQTRTLETALPPEIWFQVLRLLPWNLLMSVSRVCKQWNEIAAYLQKRVAKQNYKEDVWRGICVCGVCVPSKRDIHSALVLIKTGVLEKEAMDAQCHMILRRMHTTQHQMFEREVQFIAFMARLGRIYALSALKLVKIDTSEIAPTNLNCLLRLPYEKLSLIQVKLSSLASLKHIACETLILENMSLRKRDTGIITYVLEHCVCRIQLHFVNFSLTKLIQYDGKGKCGRIELLSSSLRYVDWIRLWIWTRRIRWRVYRSRPHMYKRIVFIRKTMT